MSDLDRICEQCDKEFSSFVETICDDCSDENHKEVQDCIDRLNKELKAARRVVSAGEKLQEFLPCGATLSNEEVSAWAKHYEALEAYKQTKEGEND